MTTISSTPGANPMASMHIGGKGHGHGMKGLTTDTDSSTDSPFTDSLTSATSATAAPSTTTAAGTATSAASALETTVAAQLQNLLGIA